MKKKRKCFWINVFVLLLFLLASSNLAFGEKKKTKPGPIAITGIIVEGDLDEDSNVLSVYIQTNQEE